MLGDDADLREELWRRLKGLVDRDSDGRLRFRNSLVRDTAYEGLPYRRRRELHARAAVGIEKAAASLEDEAATLALHYSAAGSHAKPDLRAVGSRSSTRCGSERRGIPAVRAGAGVGSASPWRWSTRARASARRSRRRARGGWALGQSMEALGRAGALLADDPVERARIFALRTRARVRTGPCSRALRETASGLRLLEGHEAPAAVAIRARLLGMRAEIQIFQGRARVPIRVAELAVAEAEQVGSSRRSCTHIRRWTALFSCW